MAEDRLQELFDKAPVLGIKDDSRFIIMSDFHMGDGGKNDDFRGNGALVEEALREYYLPRDYTLILNGDIEERLRTRRENILKAWPGMYGVFDQFRQKNRFWWLQGNHEIVAGSVPTLAHGTGPDTPGYSSSVPGADRDGSHRPGSVPDGGADPYDGDALRLVDGDRSFLIFHGHQAGLANSGKYNHLIGPALRIFANSLGIGNRSVAHSDDRRFKIEKRVYEFSRSQGIASIIGHTHRPLFESLTKAESLGYQIEQLCREFATARPAEKSRIQEAISHLKRELLEKGSRDSKHHTENHLADSVYGDILVPCLFNSGCCIGKRGISGVEIKNGRIYLVFWSSPERIAIKKEYSLYKASHQVKSGAFRTILRRESLDYIFSRIQLLR